MTKCRIKKIDSDWEITTARSLDEIEAIRPIWKEMQRNEPFPTPNADINRYLSVIDAVEGNVQPHVTVFYYRGNPEALMVGRTQNSKIECKIGYRTLFKPSLRSLSVVYGGIIGKLTPYTASIVLQELRNLLSRGDADVIFFNHLRTNSPAYQLARTMPGLLCRSYFLRVEPHWRMSIPKTIDLFYQNRSKKHRGNLHRYIRKLEDQYGGQVKVITGCRKNELDKAIRAIASVSAKTYQSSLGSGFVDNARNRTLMRTAAKSGWLRAHILFITDEPCAFQLGLHYGRTYFLEQIGFDPHWKRFNAGTVLFVKVLEELCRDHTVDYLDFGFGEANYKQSYGNEKWFETSVYIFAPRLYPIFINTLRSSMMGLNLGLEYVSNKAGFVGWFKRYWRDLLEAKSLEKVKR